MRRLPVRLVVVLLVLVSYASSTFVSTGSGRQRLAAPCDSAQVESESGAVVAPMQVFSDASASGGRYVSVPIGSGNNQGHVTVSIQAPCAGRYQVQARVRAQSLTSDSFWVSVDGGAEAQWGFVNHVFGAWFWEAVSHFDGSSTVVCEYTLSAGTHTVRFRAREAGAQLDAIKLVAVGSTTPAATPTCSAVPLPLDVMLLIDCSGSMRYDLESEKTAAQGFVDRLNPAQDQVGVVSFSTSAQLVHHLTHDFNAVKSAIQGLEYSGWTNMSAALNTGQAELVSVRHNPSARPVIILMSDGVPEEVDTPAAALSAAQAAKNAGTRIFTIGLGSVNHSLMQQLASSPGDYYSAPTSANLDAIYQAIAGSLCRPTIAPTVRPAFGKVCLPSVLKGWTKGSVAGRVVSAVTGLPIPGGTVCALATGQCVTTDGNGNYRIDGIPIGQQTLRASAGGYVSLEQSTGVDGGVTVMLNFALSPQLGQGEMRIVLTWGQDPRDLDSHLWLPSGQPYHVYYPRSHRGSLTSWPWANLDVDDTSGYGPETVTIVQRYPGTYVYAVYLYSGSGSLATSGARVQVYGTGGLVREFQVPGSGSGRWWYVFDLDGASGGITARNYITMNCPASYECTGSSAEAAEK